MAHSDVANLLEIDEGVAPPAPVEGGREGGGGGGDSR